MTTFPVLYLRSLNIRELEAFESENNNKGILIFPRIPSQLLIILQAAICSPTHLLIILSTVDRL